MKFSKLFSVLAIALVLTLTACGNSAASNEKDAATTGEVAEAPAEEETAVEEVLESETDTSSDEGVEYPLTITHALGEIVLKSKPERIATIGWGNQDVPLALADDSDSFAIEISAENIEAITDKDIIIAYGDKALLEALQADPLLGTIPAIERGSVVMLEDGTPMAASSTPSALSIPASIDEYLNMLGEAADKVQ